MRQYLDILEDVLAKGKRKSDPQGVGNVAVFVREMRFQMSDGFPLVTTKKVHFHYVLGELLWFLRGDRRVDFLKRNKIPIWNPWAAKEVCEKYGLEEGDLGPIYGPQWIHWRKRDGGEINQIARLIEGLKTNPDSRRHVVTAWNPEDVDSVAVAPCHYMFKCFVANGILSLHLNQRSADFFIGVPYNIASYATLLLMLAQVSDLKAGELILTTEDTHVYLNHIEAARFQLTRKPRSLPKLWVNPEVKNIFDFTFGDFRLEGYDPHPFIAAEVGV